MRNTDGQWFLPQKIPECIPNYYEPCSEKRFEEHYLHNIVNSCGLIHTSHCWFDELVLIWHSKLLLRAKWFHNFNIFTSRVMLEDCKAVKMALWIRSHLVKGEISYVCSHQDKLTALRQSKNSGYLQVFTFWQSIDGRACLKHLNELHSFDKNKYILIRWERTTIIIICCDTRLSCNDEPLLTVSKTWCHEFVFNLENRSTAGDN